MKLLLRHIGDGTFEVATTPDLRVAHKITVGQSAWFEFRTPKSIKQNKFIHAAFTAAWENQRKDRWVSVDHLQAAAFCAVGHCSIIEVDPEIVADELRFADLMADLFANLRGKGVNPILAEVGGRLQIRIAKSWGDATHEQRCVIVDQVLAWFCSEDGPCPGANPDDFFDTAAMESA